MRSRVHHMMVFPSSAVYSVTTPISKATYLSISELVSGTGAMFLLFYGWDVFSGRRLLYNMGNVLLIYSPCLDLSLSWEWTLVCKFSYRFHIELKYK
jgi:hypothetical protein